MIPTGHFLILSIILFWIGLLGIIVRRNFLMILLSIELMLNAANLNFIAGAALYGSVNGHLNAFLSMVVAAAEVTVGLAIAVVFFQNKDSVDTQEADSLRG